MDNTFDLFNPYTTTTPSSMPEPVVKEKKVSESERLEKEVENLRNLLKEQASAADRKINEQTTSIQALKKTLEDALAALKTEKIKEAKAAKSSVTEQWNMFDPSQKSIPTSEVQEEMTPEEIDALVQKKVSELATKSYEYQVSAKQKEEELVQKFQSSEFKDLHPHSQKVAALWAQFSQANPNEDPDTRFQRTMTAARQLLVSSASPVPEGGGYVPTSDPDTKTRKPKTFSDAVNVEIAAEKERHAALEKYVAERVRNQNQKLGFDYSKLT